MRWLRLTGWLWLGVSGFYALFALGAAAATAAALTGLTEASPMRAAPPLFVAHALTGAVALLAVSVQLVLVAPPGRRHRVVGRTYVLAAAATCGLSVPVVVAFDVDALTKACFLAEAGLWLATTLVAYRHIRAGRVARHRAWMVRSFALAAFFVTFSVWDPVTAALPLPPATAYTMAVVLAWAGNLAIAEVCLARWGDVPKHPRAPQLRTAGDRGRGRGGGHPIRAEGQRLDAAVGGQPGGVRRGGTGGG
jgi:uncharacterized membrane protein